MKRNMSRTTQLRQRLTKKPTRNLVTHNDLIRISTFIFGNIDPLAEACSISFDDLCEIKKDCTRNDTNALRILEKWVQDNPRCTKEDLHKLLLLTKQKHAAKRYRLYNQTPNSFHCLFLLQFISTKIQNIAIFFV